jgi:hypothetical protein
MWPAGGPVSSPAGLGELIPEASHAPPTLTLALSTGRRNWRAGDGDMFSQSLAQ